MISACSLFPKTCLAVRRLNFREPRVPKFAAQLSAPFDAFAPLGTFAAVAVVSHNTDEVAVYAPYALLGRVVR